MSVITIVIILIIAVRYGEQSLNCFERKRILKTPEMA